MARFGEARAAEYALSLNRPPRLALRLTEPDGGSENLRRATFSELVPGALLIDRTCPVPQPTLCSKAQDEASQLIPHLLGLDRRLEGLGCVRGPGREGCHPLLHVRKGGKRDCYRYPSGAGATLARRPGQNCIGFDVLVADARQSPPFRKKFDAVLADVPCSGLGTLRRNPEIKWRFNPDQLGSLQSTQEQILASAAEAVRPGGLLTYSTCSTEPEENEQVVYGFLSRHREFRLRRPSSPPGIESWLGSDGMLRTFPGVRLWDGFFAALLEREG